MVQHDGPVIMLPLHPSVHDPLGWPSALQLSACACIVPWCLRCFLRCVAGMSSLQNCKRMRAALNDDDRHKLWYAQSTVAGWENVPDRAVGDELDEVLCSLFVCVRVHET